jgi:UDP-N-acetylglucosamine 2-epimerase (non-hydrolysing)
VLVLRKKTERPEAVSASTALIAGTNERDIVNAVERLLDDPAACQQMGRRHNSYGDGCAIGMIVAFFIERLTLAPLAAV